MAVVALFVHVPVDLASALVAGDADEDVVVAVLGDTFRTTPGNLSEALRVALFAGGKSSGLRKKRPLAFQRGECIPSVPDALGRGHEERGLSSNERVRLLHLVERRFAASASAWAAPSSAIASSIPPRNFLYSGPSPRKLRVGDLAAVFFLMFREKERRVVDDPC